jgi:hypothetical protein
MAVGMEMPNWFDKEFGDPMAGSTTAEESLAMIVGNPRIILTVQTALDNHDLNAQKGMKGPSRSQAVRNALAEVLQAQD